MSKHDIDQILQAAFGDMDEKEKSQLTEGLSASPEAEKEFNQAASLKQALNSLGDVPECQLSNERLKQAILNKGVKPQKAAPLWIKWLAPAGLAAVAAYAAFIVIPSSFNSSPSTNTMAAISSGEPAIPAEAESLDSNPEPQISNTYASSALTQDTVSNAIEKAKERRLLAMRTPDEKPTSLDSIASQPLRRTATSRKPSKPVDTERLAYTIASNALSPVTDVAAANALLEQESNPNTATKTITTTLAQPEMDSAPAMTRSTPGPMSNVVVIAPEIDPETGAPLASEELKNDIVFGG